MRKYLINAAKPRSHAHIVDGKDTFCRMLSTGGIKASSYEATDNSGSREICHMCETRESGQPINHGDVLDALRVMIAAWEAKTTRDGLKMIGLTGDISFPAMPSRIKSYADAKRVLLAAEKKP